MSPPSLHAVVEAPGEHGAAELLAAHAEQLAAVVDAAGEETASIDPDVLDAITGGDPAAVGELALGDVAAVLALADGTPAADALVDEALEELLFGMTTAVLDVEVLAAELPQDLEPREVQGILEGRHPTSLHVYATLQAVIAGRGA
ncbi:MAG: DUF5791 family protein [Halobacteriales archaeon]|nr:DUF5791 family protein [Halobacteriales archaeon]